MSDCSACRTGYGCSQRISPICAAASPLPLVADIHFDYRLAIAAAEGGASKIRINPGNIGGKERVKAVVDVCREKPIPIRIGVNGGSLEKEILQKYGHPTAEALVESAMGHVRLLEEQNFHDICISMKSSSVPVTMAAYRLMNEKTDLSSAFGSYGNRNRPYGTDQVCNGDRRPFVYGDWQHTACQSYC